jgi:hypothetical protein
MHIGGFLLAGTGIQSAFILSVLMYGTALWAIRTIRSRIPRAAGSGAVLARIGEGIAVVRSDSRLIGVLVVTVIYNLSLRVALYQHDPRHRPRPGAGGRIFDDQTKWHCSPAGGTSVAESKIGSCLWLAPRQATPFVDLNQRRRILGGSTILR